MNAIRRVCASFIAAVAILVAPAQAAVTGEALHITVPFVPHGPAIDGTISDPIWQQGTTVDLGFDRRTHGPSTEPTKAYILTDGTSLYVAFSATQNRAAIVANQRNNNTGVDTDDEVKIALWPSGKGGVTYNFIATPLGTRYQYSTENTAYEPTWDAAGHMQAGSYTVTMRIPLSIMRGARKSAWLVNFTRFEATTGSVYAWSGGPEFQGTTDANFGRPLIGLPESASARPKPRVGLYGLASGASPANGGSTSRMGADLAIPITDATSLIAAIHPDFSNVELDQQTIAPTAFRRYYTETRPFFTQGANYYNNFNCNACNTEQTLYTPSIPTPRDGYAIEGKRGPLTFAGFDAVGEGRIDTAQSLIFINTPQTFNISAQRVSVDGNTTAATLPGSVFHDDTFEFGTSVGDNKHLSAYANYGFERASSNWLTDAGQATYREIGGGWHDPNSFFGGAYRTIGAQFNPYDGFFTHATDLSGANSEMKGYGFDANHVWLPQHGILRSFAGDIYNDSYHGAGGLTEMDFNVQADVVTRALWEVQQNAGSSYFMVNGAVVPVTQETTKLVYHSSTATPTSISFANGRYGPGRLNTWFRATTMKAGNRGLLTFELDDTRQYLDRPQADGTLLNVQWLERASYSYQLDPNTSFAIGVRRFFGPPPVPNGGNTCTIAAPGNPFALGYCPNISFAFRRRFRHDELYVSYGDASQPLTVPQFLVKLIHYVGAEKGT